MTVTKGGFSITILTQSASQVSVAHFAPKSLTLPFSISLFSFAPMYAYRESCSSRSGFRQRCAIFYEKHWSCASLLDSAK